MEAVTLAINDRRTLGLNHHQFYARTTVSKLVRCLTKLLVTASSAQHFNQHTMPLFLINLAHLFAKTTLVNATQLIQQDAG
jgi:hypothetical protein